MLRSTFDRLVSYVGLLLAVLLLVVSGLAFWGASFASGTVSDQLSAQKIMMPTEQAMDGLSDADKAALKPFVGQALDNGDAAKAYADHYILAHMNASGVSTEGVGKVVTYNEASALCRAVPADQQAASPICALRGSLFQGDTLRSMLLTAYAFGTIGKIAMVGAIVTLVGGIGMALLAVFGFNHARRAGKVSLDEQLAPAGKPTS